MLFSVEVEGGWGRGFGKVLLLRISSASEMFQISILRCGQPTNFFSK
jgi:hypothetical protein